MLDMFKEVTSGLTELFLINKIAYAKSPPLDSTVGEQALSCGDDAFEIFSGWVNYEFLILIVLLLATTVFLGGYFNRSQREAERQKYGWRRTVKIFFLTTLLIFSAGLYLVSGLSLTTSAYLGVFIHPIVLLSLTVSIVLSLGFYTRRKSMSYAFRAFVISFLSLILVSIIGIALIHLLF